MPDQAHGGQRRDPAVTPDQAGPGRWWQQPAHRAVEDPGAASFEDLEDVFDIEAAADFGRGRVLSRQGASVRFRPEVAGLQGLVQLCYRQSTR